MIWDLPPYPAYRDSGVPWLGTVPEHWEVLSVRRCCRVFAGATPSRAVPDYWTNGTVPWLASGDVNLRRITRASQFITAAGFAASSTKWIRPGSLVVALAGQGRTKGMVATVEFPTTCNQSLGVLEPSEERSDYGFLAYYLESRYLDIRGLVGDGIRDGLNLEHLKSISTPLPPLREQSAIVRFLDYADRRIRRYIRSKQKLIKLLEEQKQGIIRRAITRGLDPNVRLKPSGVEWLGDVPEHWDVTQIRSIAHVVRGSSPRPAGSPLYFHGTGAPWITVGEITKASGMHLVETSTRLTPAGAERSRMIEAGTLLLTNSGATLGIPKISLIQGCINDGVAAFLNLRLRVNKEFLCLYWSIQTTHLKAWVDLGAQPNLNTQIIGGWPVPLPKSNEQEAIVHHVRRETALLADAIDRARRAISLILEYRTRLIADVVTGKLDVRAASASLPEEPEDAELEASADEQSAVDQEAEAAEPTDLEAV